MWGVAVVAVYPEGRPLNYTAQSHMPLYRGFKLEATDHTDYDK